MDRLTSKFNGLHGGKKITAIGWQCEHRFAMKKMIVMVGYIVIIGGHRKRKTFYGLHGGVVKIIAIG